MRENRFKVMELLFYVLIVILGIFMLIFGKADKKQSGEEAPSSIVQTQETEITDLGGEPFALLSDQQ